MNGLRRLLFFFFLGRGKRATFPGSGSFLKDKREGLLASSACPLLLFISFVRISYIVNFVHIHPPPPIPARSASYLPIQLLCAFKKKVYLVLFVLSVSSCVCASSPTTIPETWEEGLWCSRPIQGGEFCSPSFSHLDTLWIPVLWDLLQKEVSLLGAERRTTL